MALVGCTGAGLAARKGELANERIGWGVFVVVVGWWERGGVAWRTRGGIIREQAAAAQSLARVVEWWWSGSVRGSVLTGGLGGGEEPRFASRAGREEWVGCSVMRRAMRRTRHGPPWDGNIKLTRSGCHQQRRHAQTGRQPKWQSEYLGRRGQTGQTSQTRPDEGRCGETRQRARQDSSSTRAGSLETTRP
jgi:hypothetical protein